MKRAVRSRSTWMALVVAAVVWPSCDQAPASLETPTRFRDVDGGLLDAQTGLSWAPQDSGVELDWGTARRYCQDLPARAAAPKWRLPTNAELSTLYEPERQQPCGDAICRVDPALSLSGPYHWSATLRGEDRRVYVDFQHGSELAPLLRPSLKRHALCVRDSPESGADSEG